MGRVLFVWHSSTSLHDTEKDGKDTFGTCILESCYNLPVGKKQNQSLQGHPVLMSINPKRVISYLSDKMSLENILSSFSAISSIKSTNLPFLQSSKPK